MPNHRLEEPFIQFLPEIEIYGFEKFLNRSEICEQSNKQRCDLIPTCEIRVFIVKLYPLPIYKRKIEVKQKLKLFSHTYHDPKQPILKINQ